MAAPSNSNATAAVSLRLQVLRQHHAAPALSCVDELQATCGGEGRNAEQNKFPLGVDQGVADKAIGAFMEDKVVRVLHATLEQDDEEQEEGQEQEQSLRQQCAVFETDRGDFWTVQAEQAGEQQQYQQQQQQQQQQREQHKPFLTPPRPPAFDRVSSSDSMLASPPPPIGPPIPFSLMSTPTLIKEREALDDNRLKAAAISHDIFGRLSTPSSTQSASSSSSSSSAFSFSFISAPASSSSAAYLLSSLSSRSPIPPARQLASRSHPPSFSSHSSSVSSTSSDSSSFPLPPSSSLAHVSYPCPAPIIIERHTSMREVDSSIKRQGRVEGTLDSKATPMYAQYSVDPTLRFGDIVNFCTRYSKHGAESNSSTVEDGFVPALLRHVLPDFPRSDARPLISEEIGPSTCQPMTSEGETGEGTVMATQADQLPL